jgi:hypothetical protein
VSDREYKSGLVTVYFGRAPDSPNVDVFVKVEAEANSDYALVRLAYATLTDREIPGEKKPDWYDEQLGEGEREGRSTHWPPTLLKEEVWIVRRQVVDVSPGAFVQTAQPFLVPEKSQFAVEVTLMKRIGTSPHRFPRSS